MRDERRAIMSKTIDFSGTICQSTLPFWLANLLIKVMIAAWIFTFLVCEGLVKRECSFLRERLGGLRYAARQCTIGNNKTRSTIKASPPSSLFKFNLITSFWILES